MTWNQAPTEYEDFFLRKNCPICGNLLSSSDPYGQMEFSQECLSSRSHYSFFSSIHVDSITILGKSFDAEKINDIDIYLDQVGNPEFKENRGIK
jgi:hypothetical protein